VKKTLITFLLFFWVWSCATYHPPQPSFYLESLPQTVETEFSLDERIATEEIWKNIREGKGNKALKLLYRLGIKNPAYYVGLGYSYFLLNKYQASEESFKAALEDYPDMVLIHLGLAQLYQKAGQENLAFTEYREVLKRKPDHSWAQQEYDAIQSKKTEEALNEGKNFLAQGDIERSKQSFLKTLYYSPHSPEAHLALAEIYKADNKFQKALVHLEAISSHEAKNPDFLKNYAETLFRAEQYTKSLEVYKQLLELQPENQEIQSRIESLKNKLGIFELPNQYHTIPSKEAISREEIASLLAVKFQEIIDEAKGKPRIIIDISTSWATKFILKMTSLGILEVYPNHTFQPQKIITRAEMAEILLRFIDFLKKKGCGLIQQFPPERIRISDVSSDNYYHYPITQILSYQIMDLSPGKAFRPDQPVSGQEVVKILDIILSLIK